ncbi:MAG: threonylcarbamoyl-AMP synthase [Flavobacteriia bacterium]|nr:threonylcarbamoyl-AMP synthase [Flavobacteriia bacterium]OIP47875.1 MAG: threonylcarbamoyl-AMP synthase [Flavobacteriaceae bacterium CG2_30_31_66]PIV97240.1 MAG: threonylcarbamoyl-AMP synthase [Flavobacteriaceae bacterium CG17_big_fil_post_rev_8_21_14_2_50_31_13]PIX11029.1 MAG: threonylcarbamoyl-AMP synthase [Flavobacteriaceae bacterium CG_4_8_14_3_um_filter_31_8]PIY15914.1 MAG: threonylcarbamoyl-AMP synthase [Flavobacteriaceae bacterium CG_4_10_14_3_um_filter_31_253]PIZ12309.1 MAG: threony
MSIISTDIQKAISLLENEKLVAIPTETVYGLAGNIFSEKAIKKIFSTKKRPFFNPLIVHIPSIDALENVVSYVPEKAKILASAFWPGSLTLVLKKKSSIPDLITAGKDTVAVRIPNHPLTLELLRRLPFPLAAPSANPFNNISPTKAFHVEQYFKNDIQLILDGGTCKNGIESTIIGFENEEPVVYRLGALSIENIEKVIGKVTIKNHKLQNPDAPGMLQKHYSPKTLLILTSDIKKEIKKFQGKKIGILSFTNSYKNDRIFHEIILSKYANLNEAATNLYTSLHELDTFQLDVIIAEKLPEMGLGISVNDRLQRATFQE